LHHRKPFDTFNQILTMSYKPKPNVPGEVRTYMSRIGSVGGKLGDPKAKSKGAKKLTKKQRRFAAAVSNNKQHGTPIPAEFSDMIHGAPAK
jgi:hypothetical protein